VRPRCRIFGKLGVLLLLFVLIKAFAAVAVPLCVMEIWTDKEVYHPNESVQLYIWIKVNDVPELPDIEGARLVIELKQPFGTYITLSTKRDVSLRKGAEWEGMLLTLPITGEPFRNLGEYVVHAELFSRNDELYAEAFTKFIIKSIFGRKPRSRTLIVTSRRTELTEPFVSKLAVWLEAAFATDVRIIYQEGIYQSYRSGLYKDFDVLIYYGVDYQQPPPPGLITDIFEGEGITEKKVIWIGYHIEKVNAYIQRLYGLSYADFTSDVEPVNLLYADTGTDYKLFAADRIFVEVINPELVKVRAEVDEQPIIVSAKHTYYSEGGECFYYVGFHPTAYLVPLGAHLVFTDILNEVYGIERGKIALVRLEDVNAFTDPETLLSVTSYLKSEGIPFTLGLIPVYRDGKGTEIRLSQSRQFRMLIKMALLDGGELVLHGASHQYDGQTALDFEFWDEKNGVPVDGRAYAEQRVNEALREIELSGLHPYLAGWETPHYPGSYRDTYSAASKEAYNVFEKYFDLLYENPHWGFDLSLLPYIVEVENAVYVPTNLGYVRQGHEAEDVRRILWETQLLSSLQYGALASFFYHPGLGVEPLRELIQGLKAQGWTFKPVSALVTAPVEP